MYVNLHDSLADDPRAIEAKDLTSACVHCGFCLSTCPTYVDRRDERDSPRGRIYLIKHLLESGEASEQTQLHLDRCLTCRNCETACPSGMQYAQLLDIGRELVEEKVPRSAAQRILRHGLRAIFANPALLSPLLALGRAASPLLPGALRRKIPARSRPGPRPVTRHQRVVLALDGCVQQAATPATNAAIARVLDRLGITLLSINEAGCCGALDQHLSAQDAARNSIRRNIDAWWPSIEQGAEAIVSSATGCGAMVADYGRLLADDPAYADKAARVSALHLDIGQLLAREDLGALAPLPGDERIAVHTPCSLQHGLKTPGQIEDILSRAGFELTEHGPVLCCGSAGSYSLLQSQISERVRERALSTLAAGDPQLIVTANIGCQLHLQGGTDIPVKHWIELLDSAPE